MPVEVIRIDHVDLAVRDLARSGDFYDRVATRVPDAAALDRGA